MKAGRMKHMIEVFRPEIVKSEFGGTGATTWISVGRWHCERVSFSGRGVIEAGEMFPDYSVRLNINSAHKPAEHWQLELEGIRYTIDAIETNIARGFRTLICSRVNQ